MYDVHEAYPEFVAVKDYLPAVVRFPLAWAPVARRVRRLAVVRSLLVYLAQQHNRFPRSFVTRDEASGYEIYEAPVTIESFLQRSHGLDAVGSRARSGLGARPARTMLAVICIAV